MLGGRDQRRFSAKNQRKRADKKAKTWKQERERKLAPLEEERNYVAHELLCRRYRAVHGNDLRLTHHACERMAQRNMSVQELFDRNVSTVVHKGSIVTTYRTAPTGISTRRQSTRT